VAAIPFINVLIDDDATSLKFFPTFFPTSVPCSSNSVT
jgi:hypothetical protein